MSSNEQSPRGTLNPYQANRLRVTCQHIDKLLDEIEGILNAASSSAAFPRYAPDMSPAQRRTVEDYIARLRAQLMRVLEGQGIASPKPFIPESRAVHVHLGAIDIAIEELKPEYMRGYGEVAGNVATELNGIVGELSGLIGRFGRFLSEGVGEDLKTRIERLDQASHDFALLGKIEEVVRVRGLVEFRPSIAAILDRTEDNSFEIAIFGRVSSGKSSLLNAILETSVLPVGVTPITAVPTRIVYGDQPALAVRFSEMPMKKVPVEDLPEFATEEQNPGNEKRVIRLVLSLPSSALRPGVSFVDTPGLGSLASAGAKETLAYLPKCDLGLVLIDAGSPLTTDDLQTILALAQAATPVNVLLSKADLLSEQDRRRIVDYVKDHISSDCGLDVPVHPVSVVPSCRAMLDDWFDHQITPLYARSRELRAESVRRKIGALRDSVAAALGARLHRQTQSVSGSGIGAQAAEAVLRNTAGIIAQMRSSSTRYIDRAAASIPDAVSLASSKLSQVWFEGDHQTGAEEDQVARDTLTDYFRSQAEKLQTDLSSFALRLARHLRECAASLNIPDAPTDDEFRSLVRGAPVFELPRFSLRIHRPGLARLLGSRTAQQVLAKEISGQLPKLFYSSVDSYWRLVTAWSCSVIDQLNAKFDTYAEVYRARAEEAVSLRELTKNDVDGIEDDLARIQADLVSAARPPVIRYGGSARRTKDDLKKGEEADRFL